MKLLCIDIGNTSAHFGLVSETDVSDTGDFSTERLKAIDHATFAQAVAPLAKQADGIAYCSVVPQVNDTVDAALQSFGPPVFHLTHEKCSGLSITYPKPTEIGQDRLANAIAAQSMFGAPAIVIDMGTAVTFDILTSAGGYEGGIIAPGIGVMTRYLHEQTALLPELDPADLVGAQGAFGKSTIDAMKLGCAIGFSGMIRELLDSATAELGRRGEKNPTVIATGGSIANLPGEWLKRLDFVENLTLLGLAEAFRRTFG